MRKSYPLRISQEVWEELERWARDELRSVNGQIEFILRQAIQERRRKSFLSSSAQDAPGGPVGASATGDEEP